MRRVANRSFPGVAAALAAVLLAAACGSATTETTGATTVPADATTTSATIAPTAERNWPTAGWSRSLPEEQGVDSERLAEVFESIAEAGYAIDSVTIIRHGSIVAEVYTGGYTPQTLHIVHSCAKSVVATLIGVAIEEGLLPGVDAPLLALFADVAAGNVDARKEALTLEHALTMTTGMESEDSYLYGWAGLAAMQESDDWTEFALSFPMVAEPGERFDYSNTASYLLSSLLQRATGMTTAEFAERHLFGPIGITEYDWPASPEGVNIGWGRLQLTPRDMARFGYLMLYGGEWNGSQVVPAGWVASATSRHMEAGTLADGYGYQWWVDDDGYFSALGYAGQYIVVLPERDAVVVFTSDLPEEHFFVPRDLVEQLIIPAMDSAAPLAENPTGVARLEAAIAAVASP